MIIPSKDKVRAELLLKLQLQWLHGHPTFRERAALEYLCGVIADVTITLRTLNGYEEFADSLDGLLEGVSEFMADRGNGENGEQDSETSGTGEGSGELESPSSEAD